MEGMTMKKIVSLLFLLLVLSFTVYKKATRLDAAQYFLNNKETIVIPHRGVPNQIQEHTYESYDKAIELGAKIIDIDLVSSKDGVLLVAHDENAKRLLGMDVNFSDLRSEEIKSKKTPQGEIIHTLDDVFKHYGNKYYYTIELKIGEEQVEEFTRVVKKYTIPKLLSKCNYYQ